MMTNLSEKYGVNWAPDGPGGGPGAAAPSQSSSDSGSSPSSSPSPASSSPSTDSAPSSPTPPTSPSTATTGVGEAFDFNAMFGDSGDAPASPEPSPLAATPAAPPPPTQVPPEAAVPAAPAQAPATEPGAQAVGASQAAAAPGQSTPPAQPTAGQIDLYDPAALSQELGKFEAQAMQMVADQLFKLTPEETEALEQDVIGTVPKLLAKTFVKSQRNSLEQLGRLVPTMIQRHLQAMMRNTSNEQRFYDRWPDIKADVHGESVRKYAVVYRQMHPTASLEQMIEDIGPMVMMANRIAPSAPAQRGASPMKPVAANGRAPQPSPFVPAGAGPTAVAPTTPELEAWEAMFRQE